MLPRVKKIDFRHAHIDDEIYTDHDIFMHANGHESVPASHIFTMEDFEKMMLHEPDAIVFGTGFHEKVKMEPGIPEEARRKNVELVVMPSNEAARKFHEYARSGRKVVAKLHITC